VRTGGLGGGERGVVVAEAVAKQLIESSSIPYSIVHATQFFEFVARMADEATDGNTVRLAPVLIQPMAADDVASAVGRVTLSPPANSIVEIAGPQHFRLHELVRRALSERHDPREVVADPHALYFGTELHERTLLPAADARLAETRFDDWLSQANARS
jgi:uncharacterized protein YbjT (DUF2867 family)